MKPYFEDNLIKIYNGDARDMSELPDGSVQMCVTSPPYWGLRKYSGLPDLIWDGDDKCEHKWGNTIIRRDRGTATNSDIVGQPREMIGTTTMQGTFCSLCDAWKGSYGLEPTPEMYIEHTLIFLREIRRVLRKDGVVFWNIGDSYAGSGGAHKPEHANPGISNSFKRDGVPHYGDEGMSAHYTPSNFGLKPKDLCLIPFRVVIVAQEDGWWVRSVIIWSKPNPMPESVTDRPTESHEYILMLSKSARYYWDAEAVREPYSPIERWGGDIIERAIKGDGRAESAGLDRERNHQPNTGRNIRSVWEFPTQPYPEAHFAVFPEKLPEICIKAATPEVGCCSKCGAPWERIIKHNRPDDYPSEVDEGQYEGTGGLSHNRPLSKIFDTSLKSTIETLGWQPTCNCNADKVPSIVLDPFTGSGTTLWVAKKLNRRAVGYELSEEYCTLALDRNRQQGLGM